MQNDSSCSIRRSRFSPIRRQVQLLGCCALLLVTLSGCGGGGKQVAGKWVLDRAATRKYFSTSQLLSGNMASISFTITFTENGSVTFNVNGIPQTGSWRRWMGNYIITMKTTMKTGKKTQKYSLRLKEGLLIDNTKNKAQGAAFRRANSGATDETKGDGPVGSSTSPPGNSLAGQNTGINPRPGIAGPSSTSPGSTVPGSTVPGSTRPGFTPPSRRRPSARPLPNRSTSRPSRTVARTSSSPPAKMSNEKRRLDFEGATALAFSQDGNLLLAIAGSEVALIDLRQGDSATPRRVTLPSRCEGVSVAQDNVHALAWNKSGEAFVVDVATGRVTRTLTHGQRMSAAALSSDGKIAATGGASPDTTVKIWDTATGGELGRFTKKKGDALAIEFTAGNDQLFVGDTEGYSLVNAKDGREISPRVEFLAGTRVRTMALSLPQQRALIGNAIWDLNNGAEMGQYAEREPFSARSVFSNGVWVGIFDGFAREVLLVDHRSSKTVAKLGPHPDRIVAMAFHPDAKTLATATRKYIHFLSLPEPTANPLATTKKTTPKIVDNGRVREIRRMQLPRTYYRARSVAISPDNTFALVGSNTPIYFFDIATGRRLGARPFSGQKDVVSLDLTADGEVAIAGDDEGGVFLWNTTSGKTTQQLTGHSRGDVLVSISPDGSQAVTGSVRDEEELVAWNLEGTMPKVINKLTGHVKDLLAVKSLDEGRAASISTHSIALWRTGTGKAGFVIPYAPAIGISQGRSAEFSTDGRLVLIGMRDGFQLWNTFDKKRVGGRDDRTMMVDAVALSPEGRIGVLFNAIDQTLTVWDFKLNKQMDNFKPEQRVKAIDVSVDGQQFITTSESGHVILYQLPKAGG